MRIKTIPPISSRACLPVGIVTATGYDRLLGDPHGLPSRTYAVSAAMRGRLAGNDAVDRVSRVEQLSSR